MAKKHRPDDLGRALLGSLRPLEAVEHQSLLEGWISEMGDRSR